MKQDYLETSRWYREEIADPYQVIAAFFSAAPLASYRKAIRTSILAAGSGRVWKSPNPSDLLLDYKMIESVINAAWLINKEKRNSPLRIGRTDIFNPNLFRGNLANDDAWDDFPRQLSFREFADPYIAFRRFFKFQDLPEWKQTLGYLLEFALCSDSLLDAGITLDTLSIYFHLVKLVEAAQLIDVREVNHIDGHIKSRVKTAF